MPCKPLSRLRRRPYTNLCLVRAFKQIYVVLNRIRLKAVADLRLYAPFQAHSRTHSPTPTGADIGVYIYVLLNDMRVATVPIEAR